MDFALSNLRIAPNNPGCMLGPTRWCADESLFQRLMLQFGSSMLTPNATPAATLGIKGFYLGIDTTLTTIDRDQGQWRRGTEGDVQARTAGTLDNRNVDSMLIWNRIRVRKGLPLGLEVDAALAQAASTSAWMLSAGFKWAVVEGFRTGLGRLPDLAVRASLTATPGTKDATLTVVGLDLVVSKAYVLQRAWTATPILSLQSGWLFADSDFVDLTPDVDALDACRPLPGHQLQPVEQTATIRCLRNDDDYSNTAVFSSYRRYQLRLTGAIEVRYRRFVTHAAFAFDLLAPGVDAEDPLPPMSRQMSINLGLGVAF